MFTYSKQTIIRYCIEKKIFSFYWSQISSFKYGVLFIFFLWQLFSCHCSRLFCKCLFFYESCNSLVRPPSIVVCLFSHFSHIHTWWCCVLCAILKFKLERCFCCINVLYHKFFNFFHTIKIIIITIITSWRVNSGEYAYCNDIHNTIHYICIKGMCSK